MCRKLREAENMKSGNLNRSSVKTRNLIRATFAEMLGEKKEIGKISVSELTTRANINRGTFYSHYDDIYSVAEDYENELIDRFFDNAKLLDSQNFDQFCDAIFAYIKENDANYKMLCRSNDLLFAAKKLAALAANKFLDICYSNKSLKDRQFIDLEINVFIEGLLCEYVKYCRGYSSVTPDDLYAYTKAWGRNFTEKRFFR